MGTYGLISDIHGNISALEIALEWLRTRVDQIYCLGDVVGADNSQQCLQLLKRENVFCLMGNHDISALVDFESYLLAKEDKEYLKSWPKSTTIGNAFLQHGVLITAKTFVFTEIDDWRIAESHLTYTNKQINFVGHSHTVRCHSCDPQFTNRKLQKFSSPSTIALRLPLNYIVEIGSLGSPKEGSGSFAIYDDNLHQVSLLFLANLIDRPLSGTLSRNL